MRWLANDYRGWSGWWLMGNLGYDRDASLNAYDDDDDFCAIGS